MDNGSSDNCSFGLTLTPATYTCANAGTNVATLKVTDAAGNTATCTARVSVTDPVAPVASCKNATVFLSATGQASLGTAQINNNSSDACGIASMTLSKTHFNCSEITASPWPVTLTVRDVSNNTATCQAYVTVRDNIAPAAICSDVTVELNAQGKVTVSGASLAAGSYDNCSVWSYSPISKLYTTTNTGVNNLTITVKDWSGNASTCMSQVTVLPYSNFNGGEPEERSAAPVSLDEAPEVLLYPNPSAGDAMLEFELPFAQHYHLAVFDPAGKMVLKQEGEADGLRNAIPVRLSGTPSGVYLVELRLVDFTVRKRLMISGL